MKRVFYILLVAVFFCMLFSGCGEKTGDKIFSSDRFQVVEEHSGFAEMTEIIIVDTETNVMYLYVSGPYVCGITPLYDSNGEVQFYQDGGAANSAG